MKSRNLYTNNNTNIKLQLKCSLFIIQISPNMHTFIYHEQTLLLTPQLRSPCFLGEALTFWELQEIDMYIRFEERLLCLILILKL